MEGMTPFSPEKLLIFDYSGTLSLEAPCFARPATLLPALFESGLASLGVTTPELFWSEIVGPTWIEGSTTTIGYKQAIARRLRALGLAPAATAAEMEAAASRFVDLYLVHSRIDTLWRAVLTNLAGATGARVIIATDHYAEATETITHNLRTWNIPAQKAGKTADSIFVVANSADIGYWKADRRFWEALKSQLSLETIRSVLMIDDFGFNEEKGNSYGAQTMVEARQKETSASLQAIFQTSPAVIPFLLVNGERNHEDDSNRRITEIAHQIDRFMADGDGTKGTPFSPCC